MRALAFSFIALALLGCHGKSRSIERGGVRAELSGEPGSVPRLSGGPLHAAVAPGSDGDLERGLVSIARDDDGAIGPLPVVVLRDGAVIARATPKLQVEGGIASVVEELVGLDGALVTTIDPSEHAVVLRVQLRSTGNALPVVLRVSAPRRGRELITELGAYGPGRLGASATRWVIMPGRPALVVAASTPLLVSADESTEWIETTPQKPADPSLSSVTMKLALPANGAWLINVAAQLAKLAPDELATLTLEPREVLADTPIAARVLIEAYPDVPPKDAIIWDPAREAERTSPIIDAIAPRTDVKLPPGRYVLRATHGIGWSIAKRELLLRAGDRMRVPLLLEKQSALAGYIGCDFHVHARGSMDARAVSYEDRVKSLVGVGVECAAATEHDVIGDHGPAAKQLGVDVQLRALTGVELTSGKPAFGHFNVFPWPDGVAVPTTHGTTPALLFNSVHAMPGTFVFQLNHPRLHTGNGTSIGYLDLLGVDAITGRSNTGVEYRRDYDAIEVFNGYQLDELDQVRAGIEEWLRMLSRGEKHVATGNSDSHKIWYPWAGFPRNLVRVGEDWVRRGRPLETIVEAVKAGRFVVTDGPIPRLRVGDAQVGDEVSWTAGATASIEVQLTDWQEKPELTLYLGVTKLPPIELRADPRNPRLFAAIAPLPAVHARTSLVAVVQVALSDEGRALMAVKRALAFTNPLWLSPPAPR